MNNLFANIPTKLDAELIEILAQNQEVKIERIVSQGHSSPSTGWYDQDQDEWVILLQGQATLSFKHGVDIELKTGDHINIPAHQKHRVSWTQKDVQSIWLAVFY